MARPTLSEVIENRLISGDPQIVPTVEEPVRAVDVLGGFAAVYRFSVDHSGAWYGGCTVALMVGGGTWEEMACAVSHGEGRQVPWRASKETLDGHTISIFGSVRTELPDEEDRMVFVRGIYGFCDPAVRGLRISSADKERTVEVISPVGAFVVVVTGEGSVALQGLDATGVNVGQLETKAPLESVRPRSLQRRHARKRGWWLGHS